MSSIETNAKVVNLIQLDKTNAEIAKELEMSTARVARIRGQYEVAVKNNTVYEFLNTPELLVQAGSELIKDLPALQDSIEAGIAEVKTKLTALEQLDTGLAQTANVVNNKLKIMAASCDSAAEMYTIVESLCSLRNAFFNKNVTQVNIQNNMGNQGGYNWGSDMPGSQV